MKKYAILALLAFLSVAFVSEAYAQEEETTTEETTKKSKKEKKKKKKKKMKASEVEAIVDQYKAQIAVLEQENSECNVELTAAELDIEQKVELINRMEAELDSFRNGLVSMEGTATETTQEETPQNMEVKITEMPGGLVYMIQLGAYNLLDAKSSFNAADQFLVEEVGGTKKYMIGFFTDKRTADKVTADIKKLGIEGAFPVPYKDGKRLTNEEAAELKK